MFTSTDERIQEYQGSPFIFVQRLKLATSKLASSWSLPRPTIKPHPEEKVGVALG